KVSSKVEVSFDITNSKALDESEKELLLNKLKSRLTNEGVLIMSSSATRSHHKNKILVINRLLNFVTENLKIQIPRKKTKVPQSSVEKRLKIKKNQAFKKFNRRPPEV